MTMIPPRLFGSLATAMVTPMKADGSLDCESAARLARALVDDGCDTILLSGTTGESPTTHQPEKNDLTDAVREAVGDRAFILCGACSNDTAHAVRIAEGAQEHGADGLLVVSPYYNRPSQEGLRAHVLEVANATDLPVMLYDIPGRTGIAFSDGTLDALASHPRIKGVKDATGDVETGVDRMHRTGLEYYSGDDALNFAWMTGGASGFVSVVSHVAAAQYRRMIELLDSDQVWEARELSGCAPSCARAWAAARGPSWRSTRCGSRASSTRPLCASRWSASPTPRSRPFGRHWSPRARSRHECEGFDPGERVPAR